MEQQELLDKIAQIRATRSKITENLKQLAGYAKQHDDPTKIKAYRAKVDEGMKLMGRLLMQYSMLNVGKLGAATEDTAHIALKRAQGILAESYRKITVESTKETVKKIGSGVVDFVKKTRKKVDDSGLFDR